jgi:hypothetical protein
VMRDKPMAVATATLFMVDMMMVTRINSRDVSLSFEGRTHL